MKQQANTDFLSNLTIFYPANSRTDFLFNVTIFYSVNQYFGAKLSTQYFGGNLSIRVAVLTNSTTVDSCRLYIYQ